MPTEGYFAPEPEGLPEPLPADPLPTLATWLDEAAQRGVQPNSNAMCLATADLRGRPAARIVLCKRLVVDPGFLVFYTSYTSRKGIELAANPHAAAVLHWDTLGRQARIEGPVVCSPAAESDAYFTSRSWRSQLGAVASAQSRPIASRQAMRDRVRAAAAKLGIADLDELPREGARPVEIARPSDWGGYRLWIETVELWVAGAARVHDRAKWSRKLGAERAGSFEPGAWSPGRLQP
ncbi:MAG: pyridoxamine 5'-phosphate oxidase [Gammaproteobacteria bacterium]|nr:pyridoxamine 5'-phosphate oxidase [Gammaproteobacteria bacterium]